LLSVGEDIGYDLKAGYKTSVTEASSILKKLLGELKKILHVYRL